MERIYTLAVLAPFVRKYGLIVSLVVLASFLLFFVRLNAESYNFGVYHNDEYHTVHQGLNLLVNGSVDNFRAQESIRWLVRVFYPYALVYMNTHMGGNVYIDGWSYPSHNYVVENFVQQDNLPSVFSSDPNLRNLFHALRQQYIFIVFLCVLALLLFFFRHKYLLVAFGGVLLLGFNLDFLAEQKIFYIEPGILASLALLICTYCYVLYRSRVSTPVAILLGFLAALMLATKLSTILFALLPIVLFFYLLNYKDALKHVAIYGMSLVVSYILINFPAFSNLGSFNLYLHDLLSNFWQYAAGSDSSITVAPGLSHLSLLVYQLEGLLGYALYVVPVIVLFALWYSHAKERMVLLPLIVLVSMSVSSLAGQYVYIPRNLIPFYLPIALVALLSLEIVARKLASIYNWKYVGGGIVAITLLWFMGIVIHAGGINSFTSELFPDFRNGFVVELRIRHDQSKLEDVWYSVGFPEGFFEGENFGKRMMIKDNVPSILNSKNYPELISQFSSLPKGLVVVVNNVGNNKHLSNYVLPKYFSNNMQFGRYYVFFDVR